MSATKDMPTVARVSHVEGVITKEAAFNGLLGPKDAEATRRDGQKIKFYRASLGVAKSIHDAGIDAIELPKAEILGYARKYFADNGGPAVPESVAIVAQATAAAQTQTAAVEVQTVTSGGTTARNIGLAIFTLVGAAKELAKMDQKPGAPDRVAKLAAAFEAYRVQTSVT